MFTGCQGTTISTQTESMLDENWGTAFESAKYNQILNPEAGKNNTPVEGIDGEAAEKNIEKYKKSFEKESKAEGTLLGR